MKTSDGTKDGVGTVIGSSSADYRTSSGTIMSGNEYLTVFNGTTGAAITTINYLPARTVQAMTKAGWGDDYGNRSDRMLAAIAYLDGVPRAS
jgi:rhamnogalacturonan endolyase